MAHRGRGGSSGSPSPLARSTTLVLLSCGSLPFHFIPIVSAVDCIIASDWSCFWSLHAYIHTYLHTHIITDNKWHNLLFCFEIPFVASRRHDWGLRNFTSQGIMDRCQLSHKLPYMSKMEGVGICTLYPVWGFSDDLTRSVTLIHGQVDRSPIAATSDCLPSHPASHRRPLIVTSSIWPP